MAEGLILDRYYSKIDHYAGLGTAEKLRRATGISRKKIEEFLRRKESYTLHRSARKRFPTRRYHVTNIDDLWESDLNVLDAVKRYNEPYAYLLTVIDVFSKYAWAAPLRSKTGGEVAAAFDGIFAESGRMPKVLQTDKGTEFVNRTFRAFLAKRGIVHRTTKNAVKASVVERFNRTLKTKMWRYFTHANTYRYVDVLPDLLRSYNASRHRSIKMAPKDVNESNVSAVYDNLYGGRKRKPPRPSRFSAGDHVRISKTKGHFDKGYEQNWTTEIFEVREVVHGDPPAYKLADLAGEEIDGIFYDEEIQKVRLPSAYKIDKILDSRGRGRSREVLVSWRGYPAKFNSWVKQSDVLQA